MHGLSAEISAFRPKIVLQLNPHYTSVVRNDDYGFGASVELSLFLIPCQCTANSFALFKAVVDTRL